MKTRRYFLSSLFLYLVINFYGQSSYVNTILENLDEYVGKYLPPYTTGLQPIEIIKTGDKLFYSFKGSNAYTELNLISQGKYFSSSNPKTKIEFETCRGAMSNLNLNTDGTDIIFIKNKPKQEVKTTMPAACKSITVTSCIINEVNLHIKDNKLFWKVIEGDPPGAHKQCGLAIDVNEKSWKDWKTPFPLEFSTSGLAVQPFVLQSNDFAELIQAPNASNGWETIMHFLDLHRITHPHTYSVVFYFCPVGTIEEPLVKKKTRNPSVTIKVDTVLYKRIDMDLATRKLFFEPGKAELRPAARLELKSIYDTLKNNNKILEIGGFEKKGADDYKEWKLYYERSLCVAVYLIEIGLDQKRIRFFGYGEDKTSIEKDLEKRIKLSIKDQP